MADNVNITPGSGKVVLADEVVDGTLGTGVVQYIKIMDGALDSTTKTTVKAASVAPVATDTAFVVGINPLSLNTNVNADPSGTNGHFGAPNVLVDQYSNYETVIASQTAQVMGATGAQYDYLAGVLCVPAAGNCGAVSIIDGNGSAITIFAGGASVNLTDLKPFMVPLGIYALSATTPGWKITTGGSISAIGIGKFT